MGVSPLPAGPADSHNVSEAQPLVKAGAFPFLKQSRTARYRCKLCGGLSGKNPLKDQARDPLSRVGEG
ncbi:hypothetical protein mvi_39980 [Methylobacterium indicum]|uniref:Uncharacterized protein n=1 Tax=Methylobacterium indicum TaxID=1775910 RepID=A0A8H8WWI9_9HYPH|nr:hypothetical protein mvi_39980 [Methylobacterium indicum]